MVKTHIIFEKFKAVYFRFKPIIIFYILFILSWVIIYFNKEYLTSIVDQYAGTGFFISYFASLSEDIIFFGVIGFIGLVLSTKLPEDEEFSIRIRSLANSNNVGERAKNYLENQVKKILAYNSRTFVKVVLKGYDEETKSLKIYTEITNHIMNMCKDVSYPLIETEALVEPDLSVKGQFGYISYLGVSDENVAANKTIYIDGDIFELSEEPFRKEIPFTISEGSAASWRLCFCIYQSVGQDRTENNHWYFNQVERFTENFGLELHSELDTEEQIIYDYCYINREKTPFERIIEKGLKIKGGEKKILVNNSQFFQMDKFEIYFSTYDKNSAS